MYGERMKQITITLTLTEDEDKMISGCYSEYLRRGGELSRNKWCKQFIIEEMKKYEVL